VRELDAALDAEIEHSHKPDTVHPFALPPKPRSDSNSDYSGNIIP
jgi:hypothetical protein